MSTPLIALSMLLLPLLAAWARGRWTGSAVDVRRHMAHGLGLAFLFFATGHFAMTEGLVAMLPPWVPQRTLLVHVTGVLEILVAAGLSTARYRRPAAVAAMAMLVAFFPANVYAAMQGVGPGGHQWGPVYLLVRAPLQLVLVAWAWWLTRARASAPAGGPVPPGWWRRDQR